MREYTNARLTGMPDGDGFLLVPEGIAEGENAEIVSVMSPAEIYLIACALGHGKEIDRLPEHTADQYARSRIKDAAKAGTLIQGEQVEHIRMISELRVSGGFKSGAMIVVSPADVIGSPKMML